MKNSLVTILAIGLLLVGRAAAFAQTTEPNPVILTGNQPVALDTTGATIAGGVAIRLGLDQSSLLGGLTAQGTILANPVDFSIINQSASLEVQSTRGQITNINFPINIQSAAKFYPTDITFYLQGGTNGTLATVTAPNYHFGNGVSPYSDYNRLYFSPALSSAVASTIKPGSWIVAGTSVSSPKTLIVSVDPGGAWIEIVGWSINGSTSPNQVPSGTPTLLVGTDGQIFGSNWVLALDNRTNFNFLQGLEMDLFNHTGAYNMSMDVPHEAGIDIFNLGLSDGTQTISHAFGQAGDMEDDYLAGGARFAGFLYSHSASFSPNGTTAFLSQINSSAEGGASAFASESLPSTGVGHQAGIINFRVDASE